MSVLWHNATLATMADRDGPAPIVRGAVLVEGASIQWAGPLDRLREDLRGGIEHSHDLGGALVTPGLIDCHTHLVYGGDRGAEFEMRLSGESYESIARAGGGIAATVAATRACSEDELFASASRRLRHFLKEGLCAIEIKSGYALTREGEERMLRVARRLGHEFGIEVRTTFLAAHALPPEFQGDPDGYIRAAAGWLRELHALGLVDAVDAFCDEVGFTLEQCRSLLDVAVALGIDRRLHAEQFSNQHGAEMAAGLLARSCDHLEHLDEAGARAMARSGTVAVLLPGAFHLLRETRLPPLALLRSLGVPIAISSDHNPGSSPVLSLRLAMHLACTLFGLTPWESLQGTTIHAARALGMHARRGSLEAGKRADFVVWDAGHPRDLCYWMGGNPCRMVVRAGSVRLGVRLPEAQGAFLT